MKENKIVTGKYEFTGMSFFSMRLFSIIVMAITIICVLNGWNIFLNSFGIAICIITLASFLYLLSCQNKREKNDN